MLQQLVYAVTAKNTKVKWTSQARNGTVYVGSYVKTLIDFIVFRRPLVVVESCREKLAKSRILVALRFMKINLTRDVVSIANKTLNESYSWYIKSGKYINVWVTKQSNV